MRDSMLYSILYGMPHSSAMRWWYAMVVCGGMWWWDWFSRAGWSTT